MTKKVNGVCIGCYRKRKGYPVQEDYILEVLTWIKKVTGTYKGNRLVVCDKCIEEIEKKRGEFERTLVFYTIIGLLMFIVLIVVNPSINALIAGGALLLFLLVLAHLKYVPRVIR
ncbi:MAG: hypothetical protein ACTSVF_04860 [Candidatus Asgardarchaeia archaeon]